MVEISKQGLAKMYFPNLKKRQAVRKLRQWINYNKELKAELEKMECKDKCRYFTPRQMHAIIHYLGSPDEVSEE